MRINEVDTANADVAKLAAISQFLIGRANDTDAKKIFSYPSFKSLAAGQNISVTKSRLKTMIQQPPLSNFINDVTGPETDENTGEIIFQGATTEPDTMSVDQARATVNSMAKRAAKKGL